MTRINNYDNAAIACRSFADWEANPKKISIPILQREFTWKEEELSEIYDDYLKAYRNYKQRTGIGVIYFTEDDEKREIIDGQQRITSYYLLKTTIKLLLNQDHNYFSYFTSEHQMLNRAYLIVAEQNNFEFPVHKPKCPKCGSEMVEKDGRFGSYFSCVKHDFTGCNGKISNVKHERDSSKNNEILEGLLNFKHLLQSHDLPEIHENFYDGVNFDNDKLKDFLKYLNEKVHFVEYVLTDDDHASEFFEKLNSRGKGLEAIELIQVFMRREFKQSSDQITNVFEDLYTMFPVNTTLTSKNAHLRDTLVSFIHLHYGKQIKTKASEQKAIARQVRAFFEDYNATGMTNIEFQDFLIRYHKYSQIVYYIDKENSKLDQDVKKYFTQPTLAVIQLCKVFKYDKLFKTIIAYACLENKLDRTSNPWVNDKSINEELIQAVVILKVKSLYVDLAFQEKSMNRSLDVIALEKTFRVFDIDGVIDMHFETEEVFENYSTTLEDALEILKEEKKNKEIVSIAKKAFNL